MSASPAPLAVPGLQDWPFSVAIRESAWAYPALEIVHLVGLALVFGTLWLVELRLLGRHAALPPRELARAALPWTMAGFGLTVVSGLLLFATQADELIVNSAFLWKMGLLLAAGVNAAGLHSRGALDPARPWTRAHAALSLLLWIGVIACGRWIAYV
ncbi:MAG: hypothetical protein O9284_01340 [Steroidobacteraceae bacterium]|nr:hypothetical protein [Steroidobacteraceae bacterium]